MSTTGSPKWIKFSDYEIRTADDGTEYIRPVPGSTAFFYAPLLKPGSLAAAVMNAAAKHVTDKNDRTVLLDLARSVGLPGFAAEDPSDYTFPFGGEPASEKDLFLTGRGPEYGKIFSEGYAEKVDEIFSWLENLDVTVPKEADFRSLKSTAEYSIFSLTEARALHMCVSCGKFYYSEDPESKTCSKECSFQYLLTDHDACVKKGYYCPYFSKPRLNPVQ